MSKHALIVLLVIIIAILVLPVLGKTFARGTGSTLQEPPEAAAVTAEPKVLRMNPPNGASGVRPGLSQITVTFDQPMGDGFSWTGSGTTYPETTGQPSWQDGQTTCVLPVRLKPNWTYRFGLNSLSYKNFRSRQGVPLTPVTWEFNTGS
ncbi:MAG: Ig-like domain-containing protein [Candidatus Hydrogenedentes bacterium]|nr:Ig-like domain-containing protein [Candidatus Hydrogenedentota bacterium]